MIRIGILIALLSLCGCGLYDELTDEESARLSQGRENAAEGILADPTVKGAINNLVPYGSLALITFLETLHRRRNKKSDALKEDMKGKIETLLSELKEIKNGQVPEVRPERTQPA